MKLDIDYIAKILTAVEAHPESQMSQGDLLQAIGVDEKNLDDGEKFYYHIMRIEEKKLMTSHHNQQYYLLAWNGVYFLRLYPDATKLYDFLNTLQFSNNDSLTAGIVKYLGRIEDSLNKIERRMRT
jgi:hypothetical protein